MATGREQDEEDACDEELLAVLRDDPDYYSALKLDRRATQVEIRSAYLQLATVLHPDRHAWTDSIEDAEKQFKVVNTAYSVLSDPLMKDAYDKFGEKGVTLLRTATRNDIIPLRYPAEVRQTIRELLLEEANYRPEAVGGASGSVSVDLSLLKDPYGLPRVLQIVADQHVSSQLTKDLEASFGAYLIDRQGAAPVPGIAYWGLRSKLPSGTILKGTWYLGQRQKLMIESARELSNETGARIAMSYVPGAASGLKVTSTRKLGQGYMASVEGGLGSDYGGDIGITKSSFSEEWSGKLRVTANDIFVKGTYWYRFTKKVDGKLIVRLGITSAEFAASTSRTLSNITGMTLGLSASTRGITLSFKYRRGRMTLNIPILISKLDPLAIIVGSVFQVAMQTVVGYLIEPYQVKKLKERLMKLEAELGERQKTAIEDAAAQVRLMAPVAQKKKEEEEGKHGLVVLFARYGYDLDKAYDSDWYTGNLAKLENVVKAPNIDVTVPLQFFLRDSEISLPRCRSKSEMLGFFDVSKNPSWLFKEGGAGLEDMREILFRRRKEPPQLYVRYKFGRGVFEVTVDDDAELRLPGSPGEHKHYMMGPASYLS